METIITKASTPLYEGLSTNMLATMLLLNLKIVHGVSNVLIDELFSLLQELLPKGNKMSTTSYETLKLIKTLGSNYDSIHACPNGCVLFRDRLKQSEMCPKCSSNKFVDGLQAIPWKVF
jgi:hypothetical protein